MRGSRRFAAASLSTIAVLVLACAGSQPGECRVLPLSAEQEQEWQRLSATLDFVPRRACGRDGMRVARLFVDTVPGGEGFKPRFNQVVEYRGSRAFVFGQSHAMLAFAAIPEGTRWIRPDELGAEADIRGFVGPSGSGGDIAYLRWRREGVSSELSASLGPSFTYADLLRLARAMAAADGA